MRSATQALKKRDDFNMGSLKAQETHAIHAVGLSLVGVPDIVIKNMRHQRTDEEARVHACIMSMWH